MIPLLVKYLLHNREAFMEAPNEVLALFNEMVLPMYEGQQAPVEVPQRPKG